MSTRTVLVLALAIGGTSTLSAEQGGSATTGFEQLLTEGSISVEIGNPGRHMGESIILQVTNQDTVPLAFTLPPGWIFDSEDAAVQDLLLVHAVEFDLAPGAMATAQCHAYCVEAAKDGPKAGAAYQVGHMGSGCTTELARFIDVHRFRDHAAVLFAVWATCGDRPISAIRSDVPGETELLQARVRDLLAVPEPHPPARAIPPPDLAVDLALAVGTPLHGPPALIYPLHGTCRR